VTAARVDQIDDVNKMGDLVRFISKQEKNKAFVETVNMLPRSRLGTVCLASGGRQFRMRLNPKP